MADHEARDIAPRPILYAMAALAGLIVAAAIGLDLVYGGAPRTLPQRSGEGPVPQVRASIDLAAYRAAKAVEFSSFGWVDRTGGIARIPVPEAMRLIAEQGLPAPPSCGPVPRAPDCGAKR